MKTLFALLVLGTFSAPAFAQLPPGQLPPDGRVIASVTPLDAPNPEHAPCVPFPGDTVALAAPGLTDTGALVTALGRDETFGKYVITIEDVLRLIKEVNHCASAPETFHVWRRIGDDGSITTLPVLIFMARYPSPTFDAFFREVRYERR